MVIAPEHQLLPKLLEGIENKQEILDYCQEIINKRKLDMDPEPEGIFTGRYILDPVSNTELPIWVANFAIAHYGTGIVKCSAHDERDFKFAKKYGIKLNPVLFPADKAEAERVKNLEYCYSDMADGILTAPAAFAGKRSGDCREAIIKYCEKEGLAQPKTTYKLRDWVFSRQRYWGEPIPLVHCKTCGVVPVPEDQLPIVLPEVENYQPTGTGESPLAGIDAWVNTPCPQCQGPAKRETNTMPQWAGSCWYFLRYPNPEINDKIFDQKDMQYWLPVDLYVGGIEHAILHLLYARFYVKVLYDLGHLSFDEPFNKLYNQGMVCMKSSISGRVEKMSKSKGNVVNPDDIVRELGSDTLRMYMLFMGPPEMDTEWQDDSIKGVRSFLNRLWAHLTNPAHVLGKGQVADNPTKKRFHQFLKDYQDRLAGYRVNTAVASIMEWLNDVQSNKMQLDHELLEMLLVSMSVMVPHFASELVEKLLGKQLANCTWPSYDAKLAEVNDVEIAIQVNGKLRGTIIVLKNSDQATVEVFARKQIEKYLEGVEVLKVVYVPNRLMSFVVR